MSPLGRTWRRAPTGGARRRVRIEVPECLGSNPADRTKFSGRAHSFRSVRMRDRSRRRASVPSRGVRSGELRPLRCRPRGRSRPATAGGPGSRPRCDAVADCDRLRRHQGGPPPSRSHGRVTGWSARLLAHVDGAATRGRPSWAMWPAPPGRRTGADSPTGRTARRRASRTDPPRVGMVGVRSEPSRGGSSRTTVPPAGGSRCPVAAIRRRRRSVSRSSRAGSASGRGSSPPPRPGATRPARSSWRRRLRR